VGYQSFNLEDAGGKAKSQATLLELDLRPVTGGFIQRHLQRLDNPEPMLAGSSLENSGHRVDDLLARHWPAQLTIRDYLTILGNLATIGPDPGYHIDYAAAGVPLFAGGLDIGMRFAPTVHDALSLMCEYGSDRPGYVHYLLHEEGDSTVFEVRPRIDLGAAAPTIAEMPVLVVSRAIDRHLGRKVTSGCVELQGSSPPYRQRLEDALQRRIVFNARRNALVMPTCEARAPSMVHIDEQWQVALRTCEEERMQRAQDDSLAEVRRVFVSKLLKAQKPPKLSEIADAVGVSDRTLIRRFQAAGLSFQQFKDVALLSRATALLSQSDLRIDDIAEKLGFADASGFHRSFRRWTGRTPRQFREEALDQTLGSAPGLG
jgi:AraC-like DNA-binding protein